MPPLRFQLLRTVCRFAFHLAAGFSALALVASIILWPLSYRYQMDLGYITSGGSAYSLGVRGGRLWVQHSHVSWVRPGFACVFAPLEPIFAAWSYTDWKHEQFPDAPVSEEFPDAPVINDYALGGEWYRWDTGSYLGLPLLYPTLLSVILPAFWLRGFRRRRQARLARCGFPVELPSPPSPPSAPP